MAVPRELEDTIAGAAEREIPEEDIDASPYGLLFGLALDMVHEYHSNGTFAMVYNDVVVVIIPIAHPEAFDDGEPGTYRKI